MNKRKQNRWLLLLILLLTAATLWNMVYGFKLYEIIAALILLEGKKEKIITLSRKNLFFITMAGDALEPLFDKMAALGWQFMTQYGNALVFTKDGEEIILMKRTFFNRYRVFILKSIFKDQL